MPPSPQSPAQNEAWRGPSAEASALQKNQISRCCGRRVRRRNIPCKQSSTVLWTCHTGAATRARTIQQPPARKGRGCHSASQWSKFPLKRRLATKKKKKRSHCSQPLLSFSAFSLFPGSGKLMLRGWQPVHAAIRTVNAAVFSLSRRQRAETNLWSWNDSRQRQVAGSRQAN